MGLHDLGFGEKLQTRHAWHALIGEDDRERESMKLLDGLGPIGRRCDRVTFVAERLLQRTKDDVIIIHDENTMGTRLVGG